MKKNLDIFVIANKFCQFLGPSSYQGCIVYQPKRYKSVFVPKRSLLTALTSVKKRANLNTSNLTDIKRTISFSYKV